MKKNEEVFEFNTVTCSYCEYTWASRTQMKYVVCPSCMNKTKTGL
jgi:hypothetical protein